MALSPALAKQLKAPLGKVDNFSLVIVLGLVIRLDLTICDRFDHLNYVVRFADEADQLLILGLEELQERPDSNMLERGVAAVEESAQVPVDAVARLSPIPGKDAVVANCIFC
jgi:hypothetical protein